jgi:hypothetical protein
MERNDAERRAAMAWGAALVHLAGARRGVTEHLRDDQITIGSGPEATVRVSGPVGSTPIISHATLARRGATYELMVVPGQKVWVNGEQVDHLVLARAM